MQAVHKTDTPPGPAGRWLIERLVTLSDAAEAPIQETAKLTKANRATRSEPAKPCSRADHRRGASETPYRRRQNGLAHPPSKDGEF